MTFTVDANVGCGIGGGAATVPPEWKGNQKMTDNQKNALETVDHGPQGAVAIMQIAVDDMAAAIRAGDMEALAEAQRRIHYWANSAIYWADAAVRDMQR